MELEKLTVDLRPRPNREALDLGFALLHSCMGSCYLSWLSLWLPLMAGVTVMATLIPSMKWWGITIAWWLRPMLERAPMYILSRKVFGEQVSVIDALRAWPRQLGGGWLGVYTLGRPFQPGRSLYQAIFQLEGARGAEARKRRAVIGRQGTANAASWFGAICSNLEIVLQFGTIAAIGMFVSPETAINPVLFLIEVFKHADSLRTLLISYAGYALAGAIIGPIYVACGFALYLNRRATLEAWDIEIALRQIKRPVQTSSKLTSASKLAAIMVLCWGLIGIAPGSIGSADAQETGSAANAATSANEQNPQQDNETTAAQAAASPLVKTTIGATFANGLCKTPDGILNQERLRSPDQSAEQTAIRTDLAATYDTEELRGYSCEKVRVQNNKDKEPEIKKTQPRHVSEWIQLLASALKIAAIAALIAGIAWLLYRYRGQISALASPTKFQRATEIAGMDVRPESLPDDVISVVLAHWNAGQRREALALLYRATISRCIHQFELEIGSGATEGDCLKFAEQAHRKGSIDLAKMSVIRSVTEYWRLAAYGDRWPDTQKIIEQCNLWRHDFQESKLGAGA